MAAWFDDSAGATRALRVAPGARPGTRSRALITIVHNEPVFLPIWLRYYSRFFAPEDIYVFDNETERRVIEREGFVRIPAAPRPSRSRMDGADDPAAPARTRRALRHGAGDRRRRDRRPAPPGRDARRVPRPVRRGVGQLPRLRAAAHARLRAAAALERPIPEQRHWWFSNDAYDKPAIATEPMSWPPGFHRRDGLPVQPRPGSADGPPAPDGLRPVPRAPPYPQPPAWAGRRPRALGDPQPDHRGGGVPRWFYEDSGFENWEIRPERIPRRGAGCSERSAARRALAGSAAPVTGRPRAGLSRPLARGGLGRRSVAAGGAEPVRREHLAALGQSRAERGRDQRRRHAGGRGARTGASTTRSSICARRSAGQSPFDVVICEQVLEHVLDPPPPPPTSAACASRGPRDRVDAVPDPRARAARLRDARPVAVHPPGAAVRCSSARAWSTRSTRGATAAAWSATSTAGRPTGAGTRCARARSARSGVGVRAQPGPTQAAASP